MSYETTSYPFESKNPLPASPTLRRFTVVPRLPHALERLRELAHNLFWVWTPLVRELLVRIDPALFEEVQGNPIDLLSRVKQARLDELAEDDAFLSHLDTAYAALQYANRVEYTGLYWHFVDLVWIFLFPVLYLL